MGDLDAVTAALGNTKVSPSGVSFAGKSLKLNTEEDAKEVVDAINDCKDLEYLNMEGNTVGVDAAKGIAKALEKHPEFKRALWKDMFTGRMKTEIPKALEYLGHGLVTAAARLVELDLSDNAFGPIGVEGLAALLRSSSCYALEELRLNNNGLGIGGGKLLASALSDCFECSKKQGKPMALKVFIAGRNRLENDGAKALAEVFKKIGTLEEIAMPQNGIYHVGISALSEAFSKNKNLQIINLNDNTIRTKGAAAIAKALPDLPKIRHINFGDCLLKTQGAICLADGLKNSTNLEELILGFNEIKSKGGLHLAKVLSDKKKLKNLILDGNQFGEKGIVEIKKELKESGRYNALGSLSEDEYDEDDDNDDEEQEDEDEESEDESSESEKDEDKENEIELSEISKLNISTASVQDFLNAPNAENFTALGENRADALLNEAKKSTNNYLENFIPILMKVAALSTDSNKNVADMSLTCSELLYRELFTWAQKSENGSILNNTLLINLGLIKSEDKFKPQWNLEGCLTALESVLKKNYVPESTRNVLKAFMQREIDNRADLINIKKKLLSSLK